MTHYAMLLFGGPDFNNFGLWLFLSIGAVSLFVVFIPLVTWMDTRRKEREAFYKAETFRRLAESTGDGARLALELMREQGRQAQIKTLEGMKIGGVINVGVGVGLVIFLRFLLGGGTGSPYLCGLIPGMVGAGMLVYVFFLAAPPE